MGSPPIFSAQANGAVDVNSIVGGGAEAKAQAYANSTPESLGKAPYLLVSVIVLYLIWAIVIQQEKVREQLSPSNVAVNLHNLIVVGLTAMVFILIGKIATAKATILGIPGASWLAQLFQAT